MSEPTADVVGIGNAIVDVLGQVEDAFLGRHGLAKGSMTLIDADRAIQLYGEMGQTTECSGGSVANSMVGLASLGGRASYIGKVRDDPLGQTFRKDIREAGVGFDTAAATTGPPTGRCMVFVTPDAQRTMQTLLGASATLGPDDVDEEVIRSAAITFLEGYLWDPEPAKQAFHKAVEIAHAAGRKVALSLSDPFCVKRHRAEFRQLVENHVDVLFANEAEAIELYQTRDLEGALGFLRSPERLTVVTRSSRGSIAIDRGEVAFVEAEPVDNVVDTTGAGDLFAAGFLSGLTRGRSAATCCRIGSIAAAEVISHVGARPGKALDARVKARLDS